MWGVPQCPYHHYYNYPPYTPTPPTPPPPWNHYQRPRHSPYSYYPPNSHQTYQHHSNHSRHYGHEGYNDNNSYNTYPNTQQNWGRQGHDPYTQEAWNYDYYAQQHFPNTEETNVTEQEAVDTEAGAEGEPEHEFELSTEVLEMFAKTEQRRRERRRLQQQQQAKENQHQAGQSVQTQQPTSSRNLPTLNDTHTNLHVGYRREPNESKRKYADTYGEDTQKIKRLEKTLDDLFDNICETKAPVLWPAEPLKNW